MDQDVFSKSKTSKTHYQKNIEYWAALEKWMDSVRSMTATCNLLSGLPFPMMMGGVSQPNVTPTFNLPHVPPMMYAFNYPHQLPNVNQLNGNIQPGLDYVEYRIPPLWKRFIAELLDFLILFFMKLAITFIAVDFFDFIDFDHMAVLQSDDKMDLNLALQITYDFLVLELIHRTMVCFYEGFAISQTSGEQVGGATPGKTFMGLRVVACTQVLPTATPNVVRVSSVSTMTLPYSFARAVLKNLVIALLLPFCFPLFFNKFNRTGYDLISKCIVVEDPATRRR